MTMQKIILILSLVVLSFINDVFSKAQFDQEKIITQTDIVYFTSFCCADLDADGDIDVISASYSDNKISWYKNDGTGSFSTQQIISTVAYQAIAVNTTDIDGDGDIDIIYACYNDKLVWCENDGNGNFITEYIIKQKIHGATFVCASDFDGDDDNDVLSAGFYLNVAWYENDGTGTFRESKGIEEDGLGADACVADINNDGDIDVVVACPYRGNSPGKIIWYRNDSKGNFQVRNIDPNIIFVKYVKTSDLDNDGDMDVFCSSGNSLFWYSNKGNGSFSAINELAYEGECIYTSDIDDDNDIDIISAAWDGQYGKIFWYENNSKGNFGIQQIITTDAMGVKALYTSDIDGDGDMDVLAAIDDGMNSKIVWYENLLYTTIVENHEQHLLNFKLYQNYPNPFNPSTQIEYDIKKLCKVNLFVYNLNGQVIHECINLYQQPGKHSIHLNMQNMPSGIYFYRILIDDFQDVKKMIKID